jgi:hypothetical protein
MRTKPGKTEQMQEIETLQAKLIELYEDVTRFPELAATAESMEFLRSQLADWERTIVDLRKLADDIARDYEDHECTTHVEGVLTFIDNNPEMFPSDEQILPHSVCVDLWRGGRICANEIGCVTVADLARG